MLFYEKAVRKETIVRMECICKADEYNVELVAYMSGKQSTETARSTDKVNNMNGNTQRYRTTNSSEKYGHKESIAGRNENGTDKTEWYQREDETNK